MEERFELICLNSEDNVTLARQSFIRSHCMERLTQRIEIAKKALISLKIYDS